MAAAGGLPSRRRPQHRRPRAEVRAGRHRPGRPGPAAAQRRGPARHAAHADQAARHRRAQHAAQGDRGGVPAGGRRDDDAQPGRVPRWRWRPGCGAPPTSPASACSATCYKLARASGVTAVVDAPPCRTWTARGRPPGRVRQRRHPPEPRLGAPATRLRRRAGERAAAPRRRADLRRPARRRRASGFPVIGELVPRGEHLLILK